MGHKHTKAEILDGALAAAFDDGLSQLTFGRVAKRLGISDRIVVYYFPTKDDLIGEVLNAMGAELQATLAPAFSAPAGDHVELLRTAWPILAQPEADPVFALFFEAGGLAAHRSRTVPHARPTTGRSLDRVGRNVRPRHPARRRAEAEAAIALLDGLLLLRQLAGPRWRTVPPSGCPSRRSGRPRLRQHRGRRELRTESDLRCGRTGRCWPRSGRRHRGAPQRTRPCHATCPSRRGTAR